VTGTVHLVFAAHAGDFHPAPGCCPAGGRAKGLISDRSDWVFVLATHTSRALRLIGGDNYCLQRSVGETVAVFSECCQSIATCSPRRKVALPPTG
jgi:hypothetical protein